MNKKKVVDNIISYFENNKQQITENTISKGKLLYIKTHLPMQDKMFEKTLVGSVNEYLSHKASELLDFINPETIFKTIKDTFINKRSIKLSDDISL